MFHVGAFTGSITNGALTQVNSLNDQILTIMNNQFLLSQDYQLLWAAALGTDLQRARWNQPSMRKIQLPYVRPIIGDSSVPNDPNIADYSDRSFRLRSKEFFSVDAIQDSAGAQQATVVFGISPGLRSAPPGNIYTLYGTGSTTLTANEWTDVPITWENDLEGGHYAIVGGVVVSATGIAYRWIHQSQPLRPGGLCVGDNNERTADLFQRDTLGTWLEFESDVLPNLQVLSSAADTSQEIYLNVVQTRPN